MSSKYNEKQLKSFLQLLHCTHIPHFLEEPLEAKLTGLLLYCKPYGDITGIKKKRMRKY